MMDIGSVVLLGNELALRRRVDIIANNIANAETTGFKRERTQFADVPRDMDGVARDHRTVHQVLDFGLAHDEGDGAFRPTGNPLDAAIRGPGLFGVLLADGSLGYTRAGSFRISPDGFLEGAAGRIAGEGGQPIAIPPERIAQVAIAADGTVSAGRDVLGRVQLYAGTPRLEDPRADGLMIAPDARPLPPEATRLRAGGLEASNVQPILESTQLIQATRAYQSSQRMTGDLADLHRRAIERLGRAQQ